MKHKYVPGGIRALIVVLTVGLALGVAACGSDDDASPSSSPSGGGGAAAASKPVELRIGLSPLWLSAPIYVAQDQGFFKEENLDVKPTPVARTAEMVAAISSGSMEFGVGSLGAIFQAFAQGLDFKMLSPNGGLLEGMGAAAVKKNSPIQSVKDLSGKTYCVNGLEGQAEGQAKWWLTSEGVDPKTVKFVGIPFQSMVTSLAAGRADVCDVVEPYYSGGVTDGRIRAIGDDSLFFGPYGSPVTGYFGSGKYIAEHPDVAERFVRAMTKTHKYIAEHPEAVTKVLPEFTGVTPEEAANASVGAFPTEFDVPLLQTVADRSVEYDLVSKKIDVKQLLWSGAPTTTK